jgi:hypothetical protein
MYFMIKIISLSTAATHPSPNATAAHRLHIPFQVVNSDIILPETRTFLVSFMSKYRFGFVYFVNVGQCLAGQGIYVSGVVNYDQ